MDFKELMDCYVISSEDNNEEIYRQIISLLKKNNLTPVIGAGISSWAYPLWKNLLIGQAEAYGLSEEINSLLAGCKYEEAASLLEQELTRNEWLRILHKVFDTSKIQEHAADCPDYLAMLPQLFRGPMITTNFDRVIEYTFQLNGMEKPDMVVPSDSFQSQKMKHALYENNALLIKLHGDIENKEHLILTEESYHAAYGEAGKPDFGLPMPGFLKKVLTRNPLLFLGCSLEMDRTCAVIRECAGDGMQFAFLELPEETENKKDWKHPVLKGKDGKIVSSLKERRRHLIGELHTYPIWYPHGRHKEAYQAFFGKLSEELGIFPTQKPDFDSKYIPFHTLLGREALVGEIVSELLDGSGYACVEGAAGIGKTETCKAVYAELKKRHPDFSMPFIDVTGASSLGAFFRAAADGTGVQIPDNISLSQYPQYLTESLLQAYPKQQGAKLPHILYFDNWEDIWYGLTSEEEKEILVKWIQSLRKNGFRLLISSREISAPALNSRRFCLKPLDDEAFKNPTPAGIQFERMDSVKLFCSILGREVAKGEQEQFQELIFQLQGHPLAIVLTATQAQQEFHLGDLLDSWDRARQDTFGAKKSHANLEIALRMSWNKISSSKEAVLQWGLLYYSMQDIPLEAFQRLRGDIGEDKWREGYGMLLKANLIYAAQGRSAVGMLQPLKKQFLKLAGEGSPAAEECLAMWIRYIKGLLEDANNFKWEGRLCAHQAVIEQLPQIFYIVEQLLLCKAGTFGQDLEEIVWKLRNYYKYYILSEKVLKKLIGYYQENNHTLAFVLEKYGDLAARFGEVDEAQNSYSMAVELFRKEKSGLNIANVLQLRGDLQRRTGEPAKAEESYAEAEELYRKERNGLGLANVLKSMGDLLSQTGEPAKAEESYAEAEELYRKERNGLGLANVLQSRGDLQRRTGELDKAEKSYAEAEGLYRKERDGLGLANVLQSRGDLQRRMGEPDKAEELYAEAEGLYRKERDGLGLANVLKSRGDLQRRTGEPAKAEESYAEAEGLYRKERDGLGLANVLKSRGDLQMQMGNPAKAEESYAEAEGLYRKERDGLGLANVLQSRGDLQMQMGNPDKVEESYAEAEGLYRKERNGLGLANVLQSMGHLLSSKGDFDGAQQLYSRAEELYLQEQDLLGLANLSQSLGDLFLTQSQYEDAYAAYRKAEGQYGKIGEKIGRMYTLSELYECCIALDNIPEADSIKEQILEKIGEVPDNVKQYIRQKLRIS